MAGHSDVMLGYVAAKDEALNDRLRVFTVTAGMTPSSFDCWLDAVDVFDVLIYF